MLTSLVSLQQRNVKKSKKLMNMVNIEEENIHIFLTNWGISITFLGKMWLVIIFEVTKNRVNLSLQNTCLEKPQGGQTDPLPAVLGLSNSKTNSRKGLLLEVTKYFFYNLVTWKSLWCRVITNVITCLFFEIIAISDIIWYFNFWN